MPLNATVGSTSANSYPTVAEANAYFANRIHSSGWDSFDDQAALLVTCSQMIDWYFKWKGVKVNDAQSMKWPRTGAVRRDGTVISETEIPPEIKIAVYELALSSVEEDRTSDFSLYGLEQVKAGSLMVKAAGSKSPPSAKKAIPEKVSKILSDLYIKGSLNVVRLMRA